MNNLKKLKALGIQVIEVRPLRSLATIAREIKSEWKKPYFGAVPYLDAMLSLDSVRDSYGYDSADSIVRYFLANAKTFKGDKARALKEELKLILKLG